MTLKTDKKEKWAITEFIFESFTDTRYRISKIHKIKKIKIENAICYRAEIVQNELQKKQKKPLEIKVVAKIFDLEEEAKKELIIILLKI